MNQNSICPGARRPPGVAAEATRLDNSKSRPLVRPLALLAALVLTGCGKPAPAHDAGASAPPLPSVKAQVVTVRAEQIPSVTEITGTVRPVQRATIAAKVMGVIEELPVTLGQRVRAGDLLVKISAAEISARLAQAQSQLNAARRDLERERALLEKGASTADMVKGLEDRFAAAQAMVREAEVMLGYVTLRAPFDGVVARKPGQAGDLAAPGTPLLEIEGVSGFQIEVGLPDSVAAGLAVGAQLTVNVPAAALTFAGTLAEISSAADPAARTVPAKITVPAGTRVRSGQFARVFVPGVPVRALLAPASAVTEVGQLERVFVAGADNRAVLRLVKTAARRDERVEILSGLDDGERIVIAPAPGLREGQPLDIRP